MSDRQPRVHATYGNVGAMVGITLRFVLSLKSVNPPGMHLESVQCVQVRGDEELDGIFKRHLHAAVPLHKR